MSDNHIETVNHLKKKLDKGVSFEKTMHILYKLQKIPISIKLLEATQIGFKIRELSKAEKNSDVGKTAKLLTLTWKEYVRKHQNSRGGGHSDASEDEENSSRDPEPTSSPERSSRHHSSSSKSKSKSSHHNGSGGGHHHSDLGSQGRNGHTLRLSEESEEGEEDALTPDSNAHTSSSRHKSKKSHKKSKKHKKSKEVEPDSEAEESSSRDERRKERKKRHREEETGFKEPSSRGPREPEAAAPASVKRIRIKEPVDPNAANSRPKVDDMDDFSRMMMGDFGSTNSSSKVSATAKYPNSGPASSLGPSPSKSTAASSSTHRSSSSSSRPQSQPPKPAPSQQPAVLKSSARQPDSVAPASRAPGLDILSSLPDPNYKPSGRQVNDLFAINSGYDVGAMTGAGRRREEDAAAAARPAKPNLAGFKLFKGRTAVFSGSSKTVTVPKVYSLQELCIRMLMNHVDKICEVGDLPYYILKPVLIKCNQQQLQRIEYYNPQLHDETDELWEEFCRKDFKREDLYSSKFDTWREYYAFLGQDRESRLKKITDSISSKARKAVPERKTQTIDVKVPREVRRRQERSNEPFFASRPTVHRPNSSSSLTTLGGTAPRSMGGGGGGSMVTLATNKAKPAPLMKKLMQMRKSKGGFSGARR